MLLKIFFPPSSPPLVSHLLALFILHFPKGGYRVHCASQTHLTYLNPSPCSLFISSESVSSRVLRTVLNRELLPRDLRVNGGSSGLEMAFGGVGEGPHCPF